MKLQTLLIAALVMLVVGFGSGFGVRAYMASKDKLELQVANQKELLAAATDYQAKVALRDKTNQALNDRLHTLDVSSTKDLNEQLAQNDRLRTDLVAAQRLRFTGASCPQRSAGTEADTTGSVGDGAGVELTGAAGQTVFDLRAGILRDRAKIDYLHRYIWKLGLDPDHLE